MKPETKILIMSIIVFLLSILLAFFNNRCEYFQIKTYTSKDDTRARLYELCLKAAEQSKQAGGNVLHCQGLQDDLTTAGRLGTFKNCVDYQSANRDKLKFYIAFDCYKIIFETENGAEK